MAGLDDLPPGEPQGYEDDHNLSLSPDEIAGIDALVELLESELRQDEGQSSARTRIRLGVLLYRRYNSLGDPISLNKAISELDLAARHAESPENGWALAYRATCLSARYRDLSDGHSLNDAILGYREALKVIPSSRETWWIHANFADALRLRYELNGRRANLEEAISFCRTSLRFAGKEHAPKVILLLSRCAIDAYDNFGDATELVKASDGLLNEATRLSKSSDADNSLRGALLVQLGNVHLRRYESFGDLGCLNRAIDSYQEALTVKASLDYPTIFANLGNAFRARHAHSSNLSDLDNAIRMLAVAADSTPRISNAMPTRTLHYCNSLIRRYSIAGESSKHDLDLAIRTLRDAIVTCPGDSPTRPRLLGVLGRAILVENASRRSHASHQEAVNLLRMAEELSSSTSQNRSFILADLAAALSESSSSEEAEHEAVNHLAEALLMTPTADPRYMSINNAFGRIVPKKRYWEVVSKFPEFPHKIIVAISPDANELSHTFSDASLSLQRYLRSLDLDRVESVLDREPPESSDASNYPEAGMLVITTEPRREKLFALLEILSNWCSKNDRRANITTETAGRSASFNLDSLLETFDEQHSTAGDARKED